MKTLLLENYHEIDIPEDILEFAKEKFPDYKLWLHFHEAFWPENRKKTTKKFLQLKNGDNILVQTVFLDFQQLELMSSLLYGFIALNKEINVYICHPNLKKEFEKYLDKYESDICPDTDEYNDDPEKREQFKKDRNILFLEVLEFHNVYQVKSYKLESKLIKSKDLIYE